MKIAHIDDIQPRQVTSPGGSYALERLDFSSVLGQKPDVPPEKGGHPFAVERARLPPGKQNYPLHSHAAQWEFYLIESGTGVFVTEREDIPLHPGSFLMSEPGEAHALRNTDPTHDLVYLIIANNTLADLIHYPRSDKWQAKPARLCFDQTTDYYAGEE
ncbi:MAG: cupin domain-containing protein [Puniceicoccales bacterium]